MASYKLRRRALKHRLEQSGSRECQTPPRSRDCGLDVGFRVRVLGLRASSADQEDVRLRLNDFDSLIDLRAGAVAAEACIDCEAELNVVPCV